MNIFKSVTVTDENVYILSVSEKEFNQIFCALAGQTITEMKKYARRYDLQIPDTDEDDMESYRTMRLLIKGDTDAC